MTWKRILKISRPRFWIYELGPYIVGIAAAISIVDYTILFDFRVIAFFFFFLIPANIFIYGVNDVYDYETDKLNPKKVAYESLVVPAEHQTVLLSAFATTLPFFLFLNPTNIANILAFIAFMFFAYFYSAPPIRAKVRPIVDMLFSAGHYVATGVFGYTLLTTNALDWKVIFAAVCWCMAMHAYSAVPDIAADSEAKIATVATFLGARTTLLLCFALYAASAILTISSLGFISIFFGSIYCILMLLSLRVYTTEKLFTLYTYFPFLNAFTGMIIFWYLLLL